MVARRLVACRVVLCRPSKHALSGIHKKTCKQHYYNLDIRWNCILYIVTPLHTPTHNPVRETDTQTTHDVRETDRTHETRRRNGERGTTVPRNPHVSNPKIASQDCNRKREHKEVWAPPLSLDV